MDGKLVNVDIASFPNVKDPFKAAMKQIARRRERSWASRTIARRAEMTWPAACRFDRLANFPEGPSGHASSVFGVLFDGFAYGMLLFLLSVGQSVTLGMMNFINLAHCSFAMLGGYVTVTLMTRSAGRFSARCRCAFIAAAVVSVGFERTVLSAPLSGERSRSGAA